MCQELDNLSPWFFTKFSDLFSFYICDEYPELPDDNYAIAKHSGDICPIQKTHWHLLLMGIDKRENSYSVDCPYSCFKLLILACDNYEYTGELFARMHIAVQYGKKFLDVQVDECYLRLPRIGEKDFMSRVLKVLEGSYAEDLKQIVEIMLSGFSIF